MKTRGLLLSVGVLAVSLLLSELILRQLIDLPLAKPNPQVRYEPHPVRRFTLRPSQQAFTFSEAATINDSGFRDHVSGEDLTCRTTILALGDSLTFGMGVADDETWPAQLQSRLNNTLPHTHCVINAGTVSYGVFQEMDLLREKGLALKPSAVTHGLYWNDYQSASAPRPDADNVLTVDGYFVWSAPQADSLAGLIRSISDRLALLFVAKRAVQRFFSSGDSGLANTTAYETAYSKLLSGSSSPDDWRPIAEFYRELRLLSEEHEFSIYVVIFPVEGLAGNPESRNHPFVRFVRDVLEAENIAFVDGFELWSRSAETESTFLPYNRHLNGRGYSIIARELVDLVAADLSGRER